MPPKAQAPAARGRPKRTAAPAPEPAPVANASRKRGRVAKTQDADEATSAAVEPPKKRGRQAKTQVDEEAPKRGRRSNVAPADAPVGEAGPAPKKRMGRPPKKETAEAVQAPPAAPAEDAPAPKKRMGRPPKNATVLTEDRTAPKRRGRSSAAAIDLSRVAGSSRVTKPRSKASPKAIAPPRLDPRVRSKLRTRQPASAKVKQENAPALTKRRGRPPKAERAQAPAPTQSKGSKSAQKAAVKPVAPRKKRGYTTLEIPDKYAAQIKQYFQGLVEADAEPNIAAEADEEMVQVEEEDAEPGAEVGEEEQPVMVVEEETVITSATDAADEEHVLQLAEQLDGVEPKPEADDLDAAIAQAEQNGSNAVEEDMVDSADGLTSELNDKENVFDAFDAHEGRLSSEDVDEAYIGGAVPGATQSLLSAQGMLSL